MALAGGTACDDSFTPIAPGALQYSVFGYLDAAADTQWIRVMPIRELVPTTPDSFGASVTLEQVENGRTIELRDSLFRFPYSQEVGSGGAYLHNFWTTEKIAPRASYRLRVVRPGGEPAEATIAVPGDFEVEVWLNQSANLADTLRLSGLKHTAFVTATTVYWDSCGDGSQRTSFPIRAPASGAHMIAVREPTVNVMPRCGRTVLLRRDLWVAGSEAAWPTDDGTTFGLGIGDRESNISNAVGFVGGVFTKTIPYETCEFLGPYPLPTLCKLRYGGSAATLHGAVKEVRCGKGPLDSVQVQLSELAPNPTHRKLRTALTNSAGEFTIGGLEPGMRYLLTARGPTRAVPFSPPMTMYAVPTDTLQFAPGEQAHHELGVSQLNVCWMNPT